MKLAGVVVCYNPEQNIVSNIESYIHNIEKLFIIDNSDSNSNFSSLKYFHPKIELISNNANLGVARALNIGVSLAKQEEYNWVLTMDQDSKFAKGMFTRYIEIIKNFGELEKAGVFGPEITPYNEPESDELESINLSEKKILITSGNIINTEVWEKIKGFEDKLFIDEVDHDYCLRVWLSEYKVFLITGIKLQHNLGNKKIIKRKNTLKVKTIHSPQRMYYIVRNGLYFLNKYKNDFPEVYQERKKIILVTIKNNLLYGKHRLSILYYIVLGLIHYLFNSYGKINNKSY